MAKLIMGALLAVSALVFSHPCHEVIFIAGTEGEKEMFLLVECMQALYEEAAPVIVEAEIVKRFLDAKLNVVNQHLANRIGKFSKAGNPSWENVKAKINENLEQLKPGLKKELAPRAAQERLDFFQATFRSVYISFPQGWQIYKLQDKSSLLLLVPEKYRKKRGVGQSLEEIGFQAKQLVVIRSDNEKVLLSEIQSVMKENAENADLLEKTFQNFFISQKTDAPWLFYWTGHGGQPDRRNIDEIVHDILALREIQAGRQAHAKRLYQEIARAKKQEKTWQLIADLGDIKEITEQLIVLAKNELLDANVGKLAPVFFYVVMTNQQDPLNMYQQSAATIRNRLKRAEIEDLSKDKLQKSLTALEANYQRAKTEAENFKEWLPHVANSIKRAIQSLQEQAHVQQGAWQKAQQKIQELELAVREREGKFLSTEFLPGARVGVSFATFQSIITFLGTKLDARCIFLKTCFSGGVNQRFLQDMLNNLRTNCMVVSVGISERTVYGAMYDEPVSFAADLPTIHYSTSFANFFELLCDYFTNQMALIQKIRALKLRGVNPLTAIFKTITNPAFTLVNQPFVFLPHIGVFSALKLDASVLVLTDATVRSATWQKKPIDLQPYRATLIFPAYIPATLIINEKAPMLISQRNLDVKSRFDYGGTHIFEEIQDVSERLDYGVYGFCRRIVLSNQSLYKLFLIKKLTIGAHTFYNVIIRLRGNIREQDVGGSLDLFYTKDTTNFSTLLREDPLTAISQDALSQNARAITSREIVNFAVQTVERFSRAQKLVHSRDLTKEQAALVQEFESFRKNASLPLLFEILAQDLKQSVHIEDIEQKKSVAQVVQEKIERAKKGS